MIRALVRFLFWSFTWGFGAGVLATCYVIGQMHTHY